jgi:hypothetical protein
MTVYEFLRMYDVTQNTQVQVVLHPASNEAQRLLSSDTSTDIRICLSGMGLKLFNVMENETFRDRELDSWYVQDDKIHINII